MTRQNSIRHVVGRGGGSTGLLRDPPSTMSPFLFIAFVGLLLLQLTTTPLISAAAVVTQLTGGRGGAVDAVSSSSSLSRAGHHQGRNEDDSDEADDYDSSDGDDDDETAGLSSSSSSSSSSVTRLGGGTVHYERRIRVGGGDNQQAASATGTSSDGDGFNERWIERERKKNLRLAMIQRQIVEMLGIERRPNVSHHHQAGQQQQQLQALFARRAAADQQHRPGAGSPSSPVDAVGPHHHQQQQQTSSSSAPRQQQSHVNGNVARRYQALIPACPGPSFGASPEDSADDLTPFRMQFNFEMFDGSRLRPTRLIAASLRLKKKPSRPAAAASGSQQQRRQRGIGQTDSASTPNGDRDHVMQSWSSDRGVPAPDVMRISVYSIGRGSARRGSLRGTEVRRHIQTIQVRSDESGWIRINVRSAVEDWMRRMQTSGLIEVSVTDSHGWPIDAFQTFERHDCDNPPTVESLMQLSMSIGDAAAASSSDSTPSAAAADDDQSSTVGGDVVISSSFIDDDLASSSSSADLTTDSVHRQQQQRGQHLTPPDDFIQPYVELVTASEPVRTAPVDARMAGSS